MDVCKTKPGQWWAWAPHRYSLLQMGQYKFSYIVHQFLSFFFPLITLEMTAWPVMNSSSTITDEVTNPTKGFTEVLKLLYWWNVSDCSTRDTKTQLHGAEGWFFRVSPHLPPFQARTREILCKNLLISMTCTEFKGFRTQRFQYWE